jgi:hypothetical protein
VSAMRRSCAPLQKAVSRADVIAAANAKHAGASTPTSGGVCQQRHKVHRDLPVHGDFSITPNNHLAGKGCPQCGAAKRGHRKDTLASARKTANAKIAKFSEGFVSEGPRDPWRLLRLQPRAVRGTQAAC